MMELKDTVELMSSPDYRERFRAEYWQTKIRYEKLKSFNNRIEAARLVRNDENRKCDCDRDRESADCRIEEPHHDCPADILKAQQACMGEYLHLLEVRAVMEGIRL